MKNQNKNRGKAFERKVAKLIDGERYPADTGGKVDVHVGEWLFVQCKYKQSLSHQSLSDLVEEMQMFGFGVVAHQVPPGPGRTSPLLFTLNAPHFVELIRAYIQRMA